MESLNGLQGLVESVRDTYNVDNVVYYSNDLSNNMVTGFTYSPDWAHRYQAAKFQNIDPVVRGAHQQFHPLNWKRLDWSNRRSRQMFKEAAEFGVGNQGLTVPIRGPQGQFAVLTVNDTTSDDTWNAFIDEFTRDMLVIAHYMHKTVHDMRPAGKAPAKKELSPREKDVLALLAIGQNRSQIADKLGISEHTVRVYLDTARTKLGALNTIQAVVMAMQSGSVNV